MDDVLFSTTTESIVIQKKAPGQSLLSVMAKTIVKMNITTSMLMLQTIRFVKLPLKHNFQFFKTCTKCKCCLKVAFINEVKTVFLQSISFCTEKGKQWKHTQKSHLPHLYKNI